MKTICILGMGYIGLPTACMMANNGYEVVGIDVNDGIVSSLSSGKLHIEEPELEKVFLKAFKEGKLKVSRHVKKSDVYIIAVPTPLGKDNKADLSYVISAAEMIKDFVSKENLVILESTSPPGTTRNIVGSIIEKNTKLVAGTDFNLAFCPERVLPGKIIYELVNNNRVIGGINEKSAELAKDVYKSFVKGNIYTTTLETSEFVKLAENTYRDINIAFANELADICGEYDINIWDVVKFANMHPRVNILNPGPGVGGHCIAIDPWFIIENIKKKDTLIEKCRGINNSRPFIISDKAAMIVNGIKDPKIAVFGISYKENVGDTRESPALAIINELLKKGFEVSVHDPIVTNYNGKLSSLEDSLNGADLLLLFAAHDVFKKTSLDFIAQKMRNKNIFDTRNFYDRNEVEKAKIRYYRI
ncbi:MAG: nucleotide sugar dehydrogenase [Actinomycetota bacterium]|nr:nucleotide sugar dehydrogenase [Actinomycetota bacterium]